MPFNQENIHLKELDIHLMRFKNFNPLDFLDHLTELEKERFFTFKSQSRRMEFVATRILRHRLFGFQHIHYDSTGAPYIEDEGYISVSHAENIVGICISKEFKVGLDLETKRNKAFNLQSKFLSEGEKRNLDTSSENEMTKVWSLKEAMYKLAGRKKIIFKTDLLVEKLNQTMYLGKIINPDGILTVELTIFEKDDYFISVNTKEVHNG